MKSSFIMTAFQENENRVTAASHMLSFLFRMFFFLSYSKIIIIKLSEKAELNKTQHVRSCHCTMFTQECLFPSVRKRTNKCAPNSML